MEIQSGQDLYVSGVSRREREEVDLTISPERAEAVTTARERAHEGFAARYGDSVSAALEGIRRSGRTASFLEFYKGPLSNEVLGKLIEAGTLPFQPETA